MMGTILRQEMFKLCDLCFVAAVTVQAVRREWDAQTTQVVKTLLEEVILVVDTASDDFFQPP